MSSSQYLLSAGLDGGTQVRSSSTPFEQESDDFPTPVHDLYRHFRRSRSQRQVRQHAELVRPRICLSQLYLTSPLCAGRLTPPARPTWTTASTSTRSGETRSSFLISLSSTLLERNHSELERINMTLSIGKVILRLLPRPRGGQIIALRAGGRTKGAFPAKQDASTPFPLSKSTCHYTSLLLSFCASRSVVKLAPANCLTFWKLPARPRSSLLASRLSLARQSISKLSPTRHPPHHPPFTACAQSPPWLILGLLPASSSTSPRRPLTVATAHRRRIRCRTCSTTRLRTTRAGAMSEMTSTSRSFGCCFNGGVTGMGGVLSRGWGEWYVVYTGRTAGGAPRVPRRPQAGETAMPPGSPCRREAGPKDLADLLVQLTADC